MSEENSVEEIANRLQAVFERQQKELEAMSPEQRKAFEDQREERRRDQHNTQVLRFRAEWNAPERHVARKVIDRSGPWGARESELARMLGKGFLVALVGGRGPGKTQMAVELMKKHTYALKTAYYDTLTGLFLKIKATFKKDNKETEGDLVLEMVKPSLLVLDEIGRRSDSDWENRILYELLDRRYRAMKDTLLIANQNKAQFIESIGESLASRMQETGGIMECNWQSYRL